MTGQLVRLPSATASLLSKKQLAEYLGRSVRWVELRVAAGMPSIAPTSRFPHRRFRQAEVEAWLADGESKPVSTLERVARLERDVAELRAMVNERQTA